ncbi:MAG: DUF3604 domain-containing protein [Myxococcota bacterium]
MRHGTSAAFWATLIGLATPVLGASGEVRREAYFGDLHEHTTFSLDAYMLFRTGVTPDEAYRFAKGEPVSALGRVYRRSEPLDFMAVTDHAEQFGFGMELMDATTTLSKSPLGTRVRSGDSRSTTVAELMHGPPIPGVDAKAIASKAWKRTIEAANRHDEPGRFTALIGYEWSSTPDGQNLHRNVIFRGDAAPLPFSSRDSDEPEDLWTYMEENRKRGIQALAIPHNGNVSNGLMYDWNDSAGQPIDERYALRRALNEPLSEIAQQKGQSETHPLLSPNDEFAGFELFEYLLVGNDRKGRVPGSYVRDAYGRGLVIADRVGVNPYKFGNIGSSDLHTGLSISSADQYAGPNAYVQEDMTPERARSAIGLEPDPTTSMDSVTTSTGNLAGVWAESNTREAIYDALARKEAFATSGPRLKVRFFGGWTFDEKDLRDRQWAEKAYSAGVPMGGDLADRPEDATSPRFIVWGLKDPNGADLDRIQVVKVWLDGDAYAERVYDVAMAARSEGANGRSTSRKRADVAPPPMHATGVGAAELSAVWADPDFDAAVPAVYYLRVLEMPSPRWSTRLAQKKGLPLSERVPSSIQNRAWSSPIWYTPSPPAKAPSRVGASSSGRE